MKRAPRGMALTEVIVSASVLLVMLGIVTLAMVAYLRGTHHLVDQDFAADAMARTLERGARLLRSTQSVLAPSRAVLLTGYPLTMPTSPPLVLKVRTASSSQTVGLSFDPTRQRVVQLLYASPYDPAQPYPPSARVLDLGPARGFSVQFTEADQLFHLRLEADPTQLPWGTALTFVGVPLP